MAQEPRPDRFYTQDHEWAKPNSPEIVIGISSFAVEQLGDITLVDITVVPGDTLGAHQVFGTVESVKTLSDLFAPIAGRVTRVNRDLIEHPEWVNEDCWDKAWMIAVEPSGPIGATAGLMDVNAYKDLLAAQEH